MWVSLCECGGIACGLVCVSVGYHVWVSVCECGISRVG